MESRRANSESNIPERFGSWKNLNNKLYLHSRIKPKETENGKLWFDPFFLGKVLWIYASRHRQGKPE